MLLDVDTLSPCNGDVLLDVLLAQDPTARIRLDMAARRVEVDGVASEAQVLRALAASGFVAARAAPHSGAGSSCCGGCS